MATKKEAIEQLSADGHDQAATALDRWRNKDAQNGGWDKWFLSNEGYPDLERVVWPDGYMGHVDDEEVMGGDQARRTPPKPARPPEPHYSINKAAGMKGKTVASVEMGQRQHIAGVHASEVIVLHFTDGTLLAIDTGSNARNISDKPEEFNVSFMLEWFRDS